MQTLRDFVPECKDYSYKYSEKMQSLIENSPKRSELFRINIKNIKINDMNFRKMQRVTSISHLPLQPPIPHILITFY